MLKSHRRALQTAAQQLLETETVTGKELEQIVRDCPPSDSSGRSEALAAAQA